ncbi:MAG: beta-lactamase family protein [Oligosphaeraceae bacterium]|nr:beta-lactamase family protein [Oligosphaeraceae bacterium]
MSIPVDLLQKLLDEAIASGSECGVQLVIYEHGKLVADLCAGYADPAHSIPVTPKTLFPIFSVGKGISATAFHMLKERIGFDYHTPVAEFWPEYACNGKEETQIWHFLAHSAGMQRLPGVDSLSPELADWEGMCRRLAAAVPAWKPGTRCAYHGITYAWLVGETANRLGTMPFCDFIDRELIAPLKLKGELTFGTTPEDEKQLAILDDRNQPGNHSKRFIENPAFLRGFIPSANGVATAGAIAKVYNAIVFGAEGVSPLLSKETLDNTTSLRRVEDDPIQDGYIWAKFGLGYVLPLWDNSLGDLFGHGGAVGAHGFFCRSKELAVGFTKNMITQTHPVHPLRDKICQVIGIEPLHW